MKNPTNYILIFVLILVGCSREQILEGVAVIAKNEQVSYRNNVIRNWQNRVVDSPACIGFKESFKVTGTRYDNAVNGKFMNDMTSIWSNVKAAGCAAPA